ncbi:MAG TPA: cytochrome c [Rhizomicrobium sp.]|nr:cytochrome c [Rhizomicrobium sp.]
MRIRHLRTVALVAGALILTGLAGAGLFAVFGIYNIAADTPHLSLTRQFVGYVRQRSIAVRAASIVAPDLTNKQMIAEGASDYEAMCTGCHLAPGMAENEMRPGMNPKPPVLASVPALAPTTQFWIIKHGIKMTGMSAWGVTHSDEEIWNMVAFLQRLPTLSAQQYRVLTGASAGHHEHDEHSDSMKMDMGH